MKTAQDIITDFQELTLDQKKEFINFVVSIQEQDEFSEEDTAKILQAKEDVKLGINMSGPFVGKEAIDFLTKLETDTQKSK